MLAMKILLFLLNTSLCAFAWTRYQRNPPIEMSTTSQVSIKKLPVTVLSGFLGAGKTTLLRHILQSDHKKRYAVIVNDMSEVNVDEKLVKPFIQYQEEKLVELSNGCICCTLREDLLREVASLAKQDRFDHLIIESTGVSEPMPVAETFTFETEDGTGESLLDLAEIDSMVTVVDAVNFMKDMKEAEDLKERNIQTNENDTRTITDLLVSQVEFASVIILNKCDLVSPQEIQAVKQTIRALNSDARIIEAVQSKVDIDEIVGSRSFDFDLCQQSPSWIKAINDEAEKIPETEEYGISSFVLRARRPFHPERLMEFINSHLGQGDKDESDDPALITAPSSSKILRSKGFFWLASRPQEMMVWSQAGGLFQISPGGNWWVDTPRDLWPKETDIVEQIEEDWDSENSANGDRRQELVFIGTGLASGAMQSLVDSCLLTDAELKTGAEEWVKFTDPFPSVDLEDTVDS